MTNARIAAAAALLICLPLGAATAQESPTRLASPAAADTVRTNLWLVEALLGEAFHAAAGDLPAAPARVRVTVAGDTDADQLAGGVAVRTLRGLGHEVYVATADSNVAPVDCEFAVRLREIRLKYPETERTLGIWRHSVVRHVAVDVGVEITEADSGRVLFSGQLRRASDDRVAAGDLELVDSDLFDFTTATVGESGWQRRTEEFVVLATLAGLVAVYFANTGD